MKLFCECGAVNRGDAWTFLRIHKNPPRQPGDGGLPDRRFMEGVRCLYESGQITREAVAATTAAHCKKPSPRESTYHATHCELANGKRLW